VDNRKLEVLVLSDEFRKTFTKLELPYLDDPLETGAADLWPRIQRNGKAVVKSPVDEPKGPHTRTAVCSKVASEKDPKVKSPCTEVGCSLTVTA
jgi:hypothetical protein